MARRTTVVAEQATSVGAQEFADIVARSMPTAINADVVLTGMARQALDKGITQSSSFDEALLAVFKAGIRLGREAVPARRARPSRAKVPTQAATNGLVQAPDLGPEVAPESTLGSARG